MRSFANRRRQKLDVHISTSSFPQLLLPIEISARILATMSHMNPSWSFLPVIGFSLHHVFCNKRPLCANFTSLAWVGLYFILRDHSAIIMIAWKKTGLKDFLEDFVIAYTCGNFFLRVQEENSSNFVSMLIRNSPGLFFAFPSNLWEKSKFAFHNSWRN